MFEAVNLFEGAPFAATVQFALQTTKAFRGISGFQSMRCTGVF